MVLYTHRFYGVRQIKSFVWGRSIKLKYPKNISLTLNFSLCELFQLPATERKYSCCEKPEKVMSKHKLLLSFSIWCCEFWNSKYSNVWSPFRLYFLFNMYVKRQQRGQHSICSVCWCDKQEALRCNQLRQKLIYMS